MKRALTPVYALALAAAALLPAGCGKTATNTNSTTTNSTVNSATSNQTNMSVANTSPTPQATPSASPAGGSTGATPQETFRAYFEAIKEKDFEAVLALLSKSSLAEIEAEAKENAQSTVDFMKRQVENAGASVPDKLPETRNEKVEGDKASLEYYDEKKGTWDTARFVKEDGQWKVAF